MKNFKKSIQKIICLLLIALTSSCTCNVPNMEQHSVKIDDTSQNKVKTNYLDNGRGVLEYNEHQYVHYINCDHNSCVIADNGSISKEELNKRIR